MKKKKYIKPSMQEVTIHAEKPIAGSYDVLQSGGSAGITLDYGGDDTVGLESDTKHRDDFGDFDW